MLHVGCNFVNNISLRVTPASQCIYSGDLFTLHCHSSSVPIIRVAWFHNGSAVNSSYGTANRSYFNAVNTVNFTIWHADVSNSGFYTCLVNNYYCANETKIRVVGQCQRNIFNEDSICYQCLLLALSTASTPIVESDTVIYICMVTVSFCLLL